jgi:hypothetical protein
VEAADSCGTFLDLSIKLHGIISQKTIIINILPFRELAEGLSLCKSIPVAKK